MNSFVKIIEIWKCTTPKEFKKENTAFHYPWQLVLNQLDQKLKNKKFLIKFC